MSPSGSKGDPKGFLRARVIGDRLEFREMIICKLSQEDFEHIARGMCEEQ